MKTVYELDKNDIEKAIAAYVRSQVVGDDIKLDVTLKTLETTQGYQETKVIMISATVEVSS